MGDRLSVVVHPRSTRQRVEERDATLHVWVNAPPVEGAANEAVIAAVADHLRLPRSAVRLVAGSRSRRKVVEVVRPPAPPPAFSEP